MSAPVSRNVKVRVAIPKVEELKQFYDSLSEFKNKPVCLCLVQSHSESFISKTRGVKPTTNLFDENYLHMNYANLLQECQKIQLRISDAEIQLIEKLVVVPVQQQNNGCDCGVFATAYATSLVYTKDPLTAEFDIPKMRPNLLLCLKSGHVDLFPTTFS